MRASSLREAADNLGVSHPTIRRRLETLETALGLHLFDRRSDGLHATPQAAELLETAEQVETSVFALNRRAASADPELRGPVRVTAPDVFMTDLLMPDLVGFAERHPQIDLQVETGYELADLGSREADVAIRAMAHGTSPQDDLAGRLAATASRAVYGQDHQWIGWQGEERDRPWIRKTSYPDLPVSGRLNDPALQRAACAAGMGLTILPCFYADGVLERRSEPEPYMDIWILVHPDLRRSPRLRIFRDEMLAALRQHRPRLEGRA
jgi:DNA-binding transcriptional LysR family regulator